MSGIAVKSCCLKKFPLILQNLKLNFSTVLDPLNLNAVPMSFKKYGDSDNGSKRSPTIIMHGLLGSKSNWNALSEALSSKVSDRNIIAVDARDHGDSPHSTEFSYFHLVADINRFFNEMGYNKACLIGHSMGGRAMMLFAQTFPQKVEKLIVVDITPFERSQSILGLKHYFDALKSIKLPTGVHLPQARIEANLQLKKFVPEETIRQFLLRNLIENGDGHFGWKINLELLASSFEEGIAKFPLNWKLKFEGPTLFIAGTKSDYVQKSDEKNLLQLFPAAKFTYLDCGHWVHAEKPYEFLEITSEFLKS